VADRRRLIIELLQSCNKKSSPEYRKAYLLRGLVKNYYFLLKLELAAGDVPETKTDNTENINRKMFREGL
jgi:hypothetical protein